MTEDHNIPPSNRIIAPFSLEEMPLEWLRNAEANAKLGQIKAVTPGVRLTLRGSLENDLSIAYFANGVNHTFSLHMAGGRPQLHFHMENGKAVFDGNKSGPIPESSLQALAAAMTEIRRANTPLIGQDASQLPWYKRLLGGSKPAKKPGTDITKP